MTVRHARRRFAAALGAALLLTFTHGTVHAHWLKPEEIIAGLNQDEVLRDHLGLVKAYTEPKLPRLLVIKVRRDVWDKVAAEKRLAMAQLWYETWRHNVDEGIVAIVDAATEKSLVHFDPNGVPQLSNPG